MTRTHRPETRIEHSTTSKLTIRNSGGVTLFLFGTTYLWLTREFATAGLDTSGLWWRRRPSERPAGPPHQRAD